MYNVTTKILCAMFGVTPHSVTRHILWICIPKQQKQTTVKCLSITSNSQIELQLES